MMGPASYRIPAENAASPDLRLTGSQTQSYILSGSNPIGYTGGYLIWRGVVCDLPEATATQIKRVDLHVFSYPMARF